MRAKNIFISFDADNDKDIKGCLSFALSSLNGRSIVKDKSIKYPIDNCWKRKVKEIISSCDGVIFLCGRNINDCKGVQAEMNITKELNKPYLLLRGRKYNIPKPLGSLKSDKIYKWKIKTIKDFVDKL